MYKSCNIIKASPVYRAGSVPSEVVYPEECKPNTQDWCVTHIKISKFSFAWTVTNFGICAKMREILNSSEFPASSNYRWCLRLNLKDRHYDIKLISIFAGNFRAKVKFRFLNPKGEKISLYASPNSQYLCAQEDGLVERFTKEDLIMNNLLSGDKLTIFAEIQVISDKCNKTSETYIAHFKDPECKLIENYGSILEEGKFADVTLTVNGKNFRVHKAILAARSKVFAAMFDHEMQENDKNTVTITDINHNALKEMLNFIYTGKAPNIDQVALDVLPAADKYDLRKLKSMCEIALYRILAPENAAETLLLADLHGAKQLKMQTIAFIKAYESDVEKTQGWKNLIKEHPNLLTDTGLKKSSTTS